MRVLLLSLLLLATTSGQLADIVRVYIGGHISWDGNGVSIARLYHLSAAFIWYSLHNVKCRYIATSSLFNPNPWRELFGLKANSCLSFLASCGME